MTENSKQQKPKDTHDATPLDDSSLEGVQGGIWLADDHVVLRGGRRRLGAATGSSADGSETSLDGAEKQRELIDGSH